jgi:hypothetical protein
MEEKNEFFCFVFVSSLNERSDMIVSVDCSASAKRVALLTLADSAVVEARTDATASSGVAKNQDASLNGRFQVCFVGLKQVFDGFVCLAQRLAEQLSVSFFSQSELCDERRMAESCVELERVSRNFFEIASRYAQVIISEMHLPLESKSVRPLKMGGVLVKPCCLFCFVFVFVFEAGSSRAVTSTFVAACCSSSATAPCLRIIRTRCLWPTRSRDTNSRVKQKHTHTQVACC